MSPDLRKWGVIYHWEENINRQLIDYGLAFDKLICIRKMSNGLMFIGYFTVKAKGESSIKFANIYVEFNKKGKIVATRITLWQLMNNYILQNIPDDSLIYDKRDKFDWI
jgi:hypothetical protein